MFAAAVAIALTTQPTPAADPFPLRWDGVKETLASYFVRPGMTAAEVRQVMGDPFGSDTHGPLGAAHTTDSYFWSGVNVTFGPDGRVLGVSGGYWRPALPRGSK